MTADGGRQTISGAVGLAAAPADVVPWLVRPDHMDRWMVSIDGLELLDDQAPAVGSRVRVHTSMGRHASWIFVAELAVLEPGRVVRRYTLEEIATGGRPLAADTGGYARTVTYALAADGAGTQLTCTAVTVIPGLDDAAAVRAAQAEQKSLTRSLERLEALVAGRPRGLIGRFRETGLTPAPL